MDGIILINKEKGCTSHDVVYKVKKILKEKVGHTGTLDPIATGVLPLLIGKGTLCSKYLINHDKTYKVKLELGKKTTTADSEGEVIEEKQIDKEVFNNNNIENVLKSFIGKQKQIPPIYSAIKVNGKKLYEYARKGQNVEVEPRNIEIYGIDLLKINVEAKQIDFEVSCSKGTYIRSLCEDIATRLGTVGFMKELQRTQVGDFLIENTIRIKELEEIIENINLEKNSYSEISLLKDNVINKVLEKNELIKSEKEKNNQIKKSFISIEQLFRENSEIELEDRKLELFLNGVKLSVTNLKNNSDAKSNIEIKDGVYKIYNNGHFIGIATVEKGLLKRDIILF